MLKGFRQFILRGNVVDLAVGVVVGAAFNSVVNSLVKDVITPLITALFRQPDLSKLRFSVRGNEVSYGNFLNEVISFLIVAAAIYFFVILPLNALHNRRNSKAPAEEPNTKKCPFCLSEIPKEAKKCAYCTADLN